MRIHDYFARGYVINLPERTDRRRDMERELEVFGAPPGWAEFFPAIRPDSAEGFPSRGVRGCFLSHLGVLKRAAELGLPNVLIMEDDLAISPRFSASVDRVVGALAAREWGMAYLGHLLPDEPETGEPFRVHTGPIMGGHFYAVNGSSVPKMIEFLEAVLTRPPGHPDGGPMYSDGARTMFRARHPEVVTLLAVPSLGGQRSSRSDLTPGWKDRVPLVRTLTAAGRRIYRRLVGKKSR
jgi:hypothetical protein